MEGQYNFKPKAHLKNLWFLIVLVFLKHFSSRSAYKHSPNLLFELFFSSSCFFGAIQIVHSFLRSIFIDANAIAEQNTVFTNIACIYTSEKTLPNGTFKISICNYRL